MLRIKDRSWSNAISKGNQINRRSSIRLPISNWILFKEIKIANMKLKK